jgi:type VI secretion system protein ImpK
MSDNEFSAVTTAVTSSVTKGSLQSLLNQMTLARAAELARAGHYAEAEEVLSAGKDETRFSPMALDLLARVRAQQGRLVEAEELWTRALSLDPANPAYALGLRRAAALRYASGRLIVLLSLAACLIVGALVGLLRWQRPAWTGSAGAVPTPSAQTQLAATPGRSPNAPSQQTGAAAQGSQPAAAQTPTENVIDVRGVTVTKAPDGLTLSFDDGLFQSGLTLKPGARERLEELGRQLKPFSGNGAVQIIGMTDELPMVRRARYRDNISLGMERARFVYDYLHYTSRMDTHGFTIGSDDGHGQARKEDGQANDRARRRTVVLHITGAR